MNCVVYLLTKNNAVNNSEITSQFHEIMMFAQD